MAREHKKQLKKTLNERPQESPLLMRAVWHMQGRLIEKRESAIIDVWQPSIFSEAVMRDLQAS